MNRRESTRLALAGLGMQAVPLVAGETGYVRANTDWLAKCRYGIGVHWTAQTVPRHGDLRVAAEREICIAGAMLSRDPQTIGWAKELAMAACKWGPEGGSSMASGDIGAHQLLRGLNWCCDACYDRMTSEERETLRKTIIQRVEQFRACLNPFRGSEVFPADCSSPLSGVGYWEAETVIPKSMSREGFSC